MFVMLLTLALGGGFAVCMVTEAILAVTDSLAAASGVRPDRRQVLRD